MFALLRFDQAIRGKRRMLLKKRAGKNQSHDILIISVGMIFQQYSK